MAQDALAAAGAVADPRVGEQGVADRPSQQLMMEAAALEPVLERIRAQASEIRKKINDETIRTPRSVAAAQRKIRALEDEHTMAQAALNKLRVRAAQAAKRETLAARQAQAAQAAQAKQQEQAQEALRMAEGFDALVQPGDDPRKVAQLRTAILSRQVTQAVARDELEAFRRERAGSKGPKAIEPEKAYEEVAKAAATPRGENEDSREAMLERIGMLSDAVLRAAVKASGEPRLHDAAHAVLALRDMERRSREDRLRAAEAGAQGGPEQGAPAPSPGGIPDDATVLQQFEAWERANPNASDEEKDRVMQALMAGRGP